MVRRGRTSIVREVKESLDAIDKIGQSKRDAKKNGDKGIHSLKQKKNTLSDCQNFVKWCRSEHNVKSIYDLNDWHYEKYLNHLSIKGVSRGHLQNIETSLRLLEKGFKKRSERFLKPIRFEGFCPSKRIINIKIGENVQNRAYSDLEIQLIRKHCSLEVQKAVDLMSEIGLRVREAANVRVEHFYKSDGNWHLKIYKGAGITKGGRFRLLEISPNFTNRLEHLLINKKPNDCLVNVTTTTIRDGINAACKKANIIQNGRGTHGFRHAYARNRLDNLASVKQKQMMERILENRSNSRKSNYGILNEVDKNLYLETKSIMDKIHSELGHGKNRWELAMRYLRN